MNDIVHIMNVSNNKLEIILAILRIISKKEKISQRFLSKEIECSLGKLNLIIKELTNKKLIKIKIVKDEKNKLNYLYFITEKGKKFKQEQIFLLMKKKLDEYQELKTEIDSSKSKDIDYNLL